MLAIWASVPFMYHMVFMYIQVSWECRYSECFNGTVLFFIDA